VKPASPEGVENQTTGKPEGGSSVATHQLRAKRINRNRRSLDATTTCTASFTAWWFTGGRTVEMTPFCDENDDEGLACSTSDMTAKAEI